MEPPYKKGDLFEFDSMEEALSHFLKYGMPAKLIVSFVVRVKVDSNKIITKEVEE